MDQHVLVFSGMDGKARVRCAISGEALDDYFKGDAGDRLEVFRRHRKTIERESRRKYLAGDTEADGSILIRTGDISGSRNASVITPRLPAISAAPRKILRPLPSFSGFALKPVVRSWRFEFREIRRVSAMACADERTVS